MNNDNTIRVPRNIDLTRRQDFWNVKMSKDGLSRYLDRPTIRKRMPWHEPTLTEKTIGAIMKDLSSMLSHTPKSDLYNLIKVLLLSVSRASSSTSCYNLYTRYEYNDIKTLELLRNAIVDSVITQHLVLDNVLDILKCCDYIIAQFEVITYNQFINLKISDDDNTYSRGDYEFIYSYEYSSTSTRWNNECENIVNTLIKLRDKLDILGNSTKTPFNYKTFDAASGAIARCDFCGSRVAFPKDQKICEGKYLCGFHKFIADSNHRLNHHDTYDYAYKPARDRLEQLGIVSNLAHKTLSKVHFTRYGMYALPYVPYDTDGSHYTRFADHIMHPYERRTRKVPSNWPRVFKRKSSFVSLNPDDGIEESDIQSIDVWDLINEGSPREHVSHDRRGRIREARRAFDEVNVFRTEFTFTEDFDDIFITRNIEWDDIRST